MFKNYIKSAYRNIVRNKFYSAINIFGLSIGIIATIFILLYNQSELAYDRHHEKHERIYRLESNFTISGKHDLFAVTSVPLGPAFKLEFPEIEEFVRFAGGDGILIKYDKKEFYEDALFYTDSTIFDVFTHEFILGEPEKALTEPNTCVFTETLAKKYFGDKNPIGEVITDADNVNFKITGVIKDLPENSHLKFNGLFSVATLSERFGRERFNSFEPGAFWNISPYTYVLLKENSNIESVFEKFPQFYEKYMKSLGDQINASFQVMATPLADIHLTSNLSSDQPTGNKAYVYIFSFVALFILLIAAINYMNMATARSATRAKEVGIRKVLGAFRSQLMRQFLSESVILAIIALVIAVISVYLLLPIFNEIAGKNLVFGFSSTPFILLEIFVIAVIIGLISGSYPAFYLSSFLPVKVLKGKINTGRKGGLLRKILVVFQFVISIVMIIGTIVVSKQLNYLKTKDLGFEKENIIVVGVQDTAFLRKVPVFREELLQNPNIKNVSTSTGVPGNIRQIIVMRVEKDEKISTPAETGDSLKISNVDSTGNTDTTTFQTGSRMVEHALNFIMTDTNYIDLFDIEITEGRNFDRKMGTDLEEGVIINEATARELGWTDDPLGKKIDFGIDLDGTAQRYTKVIGVVKDFHYRSLHNNIDPLLIFLSNRPRYFMSIRFNEKNQRQTLDYIEEKWYEFGNINPFDYDFLDKTMDEMYEAEENIGRIFRIASILSIFIALLGLLGLSSFIAEQRTKEIGIRKVLGASIESILKILYKEFVVLIIIAFIIASPLAWWILDDWLNTNFIYSTTIGWFSYVLAGLLALVIGLLTISYHIVKAATANPVDSIMCE